MNLVSVDCSPVAFGIQPRSVEPILVHPPPPAAPDSSYACIESLMNHRCTKVFPGAVSSGTLVQPKNANMISSATGTCHSRAVRIRHLYISTGHSFFGRHGQKPCDHPMLEQEKVQCIAGLGIVGDRFLDFKPGYSGQISFFAHEVYERLCLELNVHDKAPWVFRRNVITSGVDLNSLIGRKFEIQGVQFEGRKECSPCYWMDRAFAPGAEKFLHGQGGLRAVILSDGELRVDNQ
jgi:MOSC domain-containing protein YiiM